MTLVDVYKLAAKKGAPGEKARRLLRQTDWLTRMVDFDPRSGEALPQALTPFLHRVAVDALPASGWKYCDRLARLTDHCRHSLEHVIAALNESPRREHTEMPLRSVRELDAACFMKLSSRPGRTIREKIAAKPSLLAVRRYQSVDLPENRLVKSFAMRLVELLRERAKNLGDGPTDLMETLERWLCSDVACTISHWDNPPPNNVLLSHRDYRRIYDAWCWMQSLDADVSGDYARLESRKICVEFWEYAAELRFCKAVRMDEMPLVFDYASFSIKSLQGEAIHMRVAKGRLRLSIGESLPFRPHNRPPDSPLPKVEDPVCIDFSGETSVFSTGGKLSACLPCHLAWQQWKTPDESVEISLLEAQDIHMGANIVTVRASDFFTSPDDIRENAQQAAMSIGSDMRRVFRNDSFAWLVPDIVDDFQLAPLRQAINSMFSDASPVPRSIAAAVQQVDIGKVGKDFTIAVVDRLGTVVFATKLVARFDAKLAKALPDETHGFAWERQPAVQIDPSIVQGCHVDENRLRKAIGPFAYVIFLRAAPVRGGFLLHEREQRVHDAEVPLWYDQLPELSTRIPVNGIYGRFYFVAKRHARISPRRGVAKPILVEQEFTLPPGRTIYEFPLYMGEGGASQFVATLKSSAFPLKKAIRCALKMTYTYGDSQPYNLVFRPLGEELKPMTVIWVRKNRTVVSAANLPVPDFPVRYAWSDLESNGTLEKAVHALEEVHAYASGARNADLLAAERRMLDASIASLRSRLHKFQHQTEDIEAQISALNDMWKPGKVVTVNDADKNGDPYCFVVCDSSRVFCHSSCWADDIIFENLARNDEVWVLFRSDNKSSKTSALWMSYNPALPQKLDERIARERKNIKRIGAERAEIEAKIDAVVKQRDGLSEADVKPHIWHRIEDVRKTCLFPVLYTWDNARSYRDEAAPAWFRTRMENVLQQIETDFRSEAVSPQAKAEMATVLYPLHGDIPDALIEADRRDLAERRIYAASVRYVGYAIGDAGESWQSELLKWMLERAKEGYFPILRAFSIALWRCEGLIRCLTEENCRLLCSALEISIRRLVAEVRAPDFILKTLASARYNFEVMLALIRTRRSPDDKAARLFIPGSELANRMLDLVDDFTRILADCHLNLKSRISLRIDKPASLKGMPDLLYALRLFLSGDDGANTISISEVGDDEDIVAEEKHLSAKQQPEKRPSKVLALFREKLQMLNQSVGVQYKPDEQGVHELREGVWGCQYRTDMFNERPWEQAFLCVRPGQDCFETHGGICQNWNLQGGWSGPLGLPMGDEEDYSENGQCLGRISHYEHGDVIWFSGENHFDVRMKGE